MLIKVKVHAKSKRSLLIKKSHDSFEVFVKAEPVEGRANDELIMLIANHFAVLPNKVRIVRGAKSQHKILEIRTNDG